jgi:HrpA-like RNA helicase
VTEEHALTPSARNWRRCRSTRASARMIVAARDEGCLKEVLVIAAALTVQDPRERPQERQGTADAAHKKFADEKSEFLSWLKLWHWYEGESSTRSRSASWCRPATKISSRRCACASGATSTASCTALATRVEGNQIPGDLRRDPPRAARRPARQHRLQVGGFRPLPRRARHQVPDPSRFGRSTRRPASGSPPPKSPRRRASSPAASPASNRSGWRKWALT